MPVSPERIQLALERLGPEDGFEFERFANTFLASEFPELRPVGGVGDPGRDGLIYQSGKQPDTFLQHSVTPAWEKKVRHTMARLKECQLEVRELIYCSNHPIQAKTDALKSHLRQSGVSLDVRDLGWFVAFSNCVFRPW